MHSVHTGGRSGGGGGGGLLLLHAAWQHGARIEEPPPPCRLSEPIWLSVIFYYTLSNWPDTRHGGGGSSILAPCRQAAWRSKSPPPPPPLRPPVWTLRLLHSRPRQCSSTACAHAHLLLLPHTLASSRDRIACCHTFLFSALLIKKHKIQIRCSCLSNYGKG